MPPTVDAAGQSDWLVQTYTDTYPAGRASGHCTFTPEQLGAAIGGMEFWLATGTAPGPEMFPEAVGFVPDFQPDPWPQPPPVDLQILAINDFHGNIATTSSAFGGVGRADYLSANMATAEADAENSIIVSAGDLIGASPLISALFHDEPTIEAMNLIGLDINGVGNHEFDEGGDELLRMQNGGCHPVDGDLDGDGFAGRRLRVPGRQRHGGRHRRHHLRPVHRQGVRGRQGGVHRHDPRRHAFDRHPGRCGGTHLQRRGRNRQCPHSELQAQGIEAIVVLMHEGGVASEGGGDGDGCGTLSGQSLRHRHRLDDAVDLVIGGHTNERFVCWTSTARPSPWRTGRAGCSPTSTYPLDPRHRGHDRRSRSTTRRTSRTASRPMRP